MAITQPTIDDFQDTTVMRVIRKVVNYLVGLVPKVNEEIDNLNTLNEEALAQQDAKITANTQNITANTQSISAIEANVEALNKELPSEIRVNYVPSTGNFNIDYVKEDGDVLTSNTVVIVSGSTGEVTIVQNTSGISINGTALQSATTAQPGLMTPALVSSLNNVNDTTNDHTTMLNAQAEAITALDDRVDALEQSGSSSGEVWEEVDLANFPSDWVEGDRLKAVFYNIQNDSTVADWTTTIPIPTFSVNNTYVGKMQEFYVSTKESSDVDIQLSQLRRNYDAAIFVCTARIGRTVDLNNNTGIFYLKYFYFNAAKFGSRTDRINNSNLSTYVYKMWRLKR